MSRPTVQDLHEFINALQLSIVTKIDKVSCDGGEMRIIFSSQPCSEDKNLHGFLKSFNGGWQDEKSFVINDADVHNWPKITLFLLLTRLDGENVGKLAEIDSSTREFAKKLGVKISDAGIENVERCSKIVFDEMERKKMTIRELADLTGLTQVSISNFRAGGDIRLSNLIKIVRALGMSLRMK